METPREPRCTFEPWLVFVSSFGSALAVHNLAEVNDFFFEDNYDYMFSYIFYLEGTVEILMSASGYLQVS